jgi:hypothetical protein
MSWREAPLYIEVHDLARRVLEWTPSWPDRGDPGLAATTRETALHLVDAVSLALTFPDDRPAHLAAADATIVRLRMRLRLANDLGLLSTGALRLAESHLLRAGRIVGGWRRRLTPPQPRAPPP